MIVWAAALDCCACAWCAATLIAVLPAAQVHADLIGIAASVGCTHDKACMVGITICMLCLLMLGSCFFYSRELDMLGIQRTNKEVCWLLCTQSRAYFAAVEGKAAVCIQVTGHVWRDDDQQAFDGHGMWSVCKHCFCMHAWFRSLD